LADDQNDTYDSGEWAGALDLDREEACRDFGLDKGSDPEELGELGDWVFLVEAVRHAAGMRRVVADAPHCEIGRYDVLSIVSGGMGVVAIARDRVLERPVAIKLWKSAAPLADASLTREARILASLKHPNIVAVYDVGRYRSSLYFVMESVEGVDGRTWMRQRVRPWERVRDVFLGAGSGLAAAHQAGIHHRDFKPANMLVGKHGEVLVLDFGIADVLRSISEISEDGIERAPEAPRPGPGTVVYMAPERLRGQRGDARSDQFSFCVSLWEALYGVRPYPGASAAELLESIADGVLSTDARSTPLPPWFTGVIRKGLAEHPNSRYASMKELLAAAESEPAFSPPAPAREVTAEIRALVIQEVARAVRSEPAADMPPLGFARNHKQAAPAQAQRWGLLGLTCVGSLVIGAVATLLVIKLPAPAVEPAQHVTVVKDPVDVILAHVAADDFAAAEARWLREKPGQSPSNRGKKRLSDEDSLTVARACLERATQLASVDAVAAHEAATTAHNIAAYVMRATREADAKRVASQLREAADELIRRLPTHAAATHD